MLPKIIEQPLRIDKDTPIWRQVVVCPSKLKLLSETQFEYETITLPDTLVEKTAIELKTILLEIIGNHFSETVAREITRAMTRSEAAHRQTHKKRDNGQPYFQHVLLTTLLAWTYAHAFLPPDMVNPREILLTCLYHDTIEDTRIFHTRDIGRQLSRIILLHGITVGLNVADLTKMLRIYEHLDKRIRPEDLEKLKEHGLAAHFATFNASECPAEVRFYKACDRIANSADFKNSRLQFFRRKYIETHRYFEAILIDAPENFRNMFWAYVDNQHQKYGGLF